MQIKEDFCNIKILCRSFNCLKHCLKKYQIDFKMYVDCILYTNKY